MLCEIGKRKNNMTVKVLYIVERGGEEVVSFADKKEADAYDKMLDISDEVFTLIEESKVELNEDLREDLSIFLAKNKEVLKKVLNGQTLEKAKSSEEKPVKKAKKKNEKKVVDESVKE